MTNIMVPFTLIDLSSFLLSSCHGQRSLHARFLKCHYRNRCVCRVSTYLPSAFYRALGKPPPTPSAAKMHSANNRHSANVGKNTRQIKALGKLGKKHSAKQDTRQTRRHVSFCTAADGASLLCRVSSNGHSANISYFIFLGHENVCRVPDIKHSANSFNFFFSFIFFLFSFFLSPSLSMFKKWVEKSYSCC